MLSRATTYCMCLVWPTIMLGREGTAEDAGNVRFVVAIYAEAEEPSPPGGGAKSHVTGLGRPILVEYTIVNDQTASTVFTKNDLRFVPTDFEIRNSSGRRVTSQLELRRLTRTGIPVSIEAKGSISSEVDLLSLFPPELSVGRQHPTLYEPGTYTVKVVRNYVDAPPLDGKKLWSGTATSNELQVSIRAPSAPEREKLWERFETARETERLKLARLLESTVGEKWDERLVKLLSDSDQTVRMVGCMAAARGGHHAQSSIEKLVAVLRSDKSAIVSCCAAYALGKVASEQSGTALIQEVEKRRPRIYRAAIQALGELRDKRAVPVLKAAANDKAEQEWVRAAALRSIQQIEKGPGT